MYRSFDGIISDTEANWQLYDPIIPLGIVALTIDNGNSKVGDGVQRWSEISYMSGSIGTKYTDSSRSPIHNEIPYFDEVSDQWTYRKQGVFETAENWESISTAFPSFSVLVELSNTTNKPTGRYKIGDNVTPFQELPWIGFDISAFPTGYGLEFNGTYLEPKQFLGIHECPIAESPTGTMFARDDGTFATVGNESVESLTSSNDNTLLAFDGTTGKKIKDTGILYTDLMLNGGTTEEIFQIYAPTGPKLQSVGGELHILDANDDYGNIRSQSIYSEFGTFDSVIIGGFPTESTSVNLTSDGSFLFVDGGKVWTEANDGESSGLDADTLDGHHADTFLTLESGGTAGNITIFDATGNTIIDSGFSPSDLMGFAAVIYKGVIDCSANPDFPTGSVGDFYKISESGLIGGEFGTSVTTGDNLICNTATEAGSFASVGLYWDIVENYTGDAVTGPTASTDNNIVLFDGTSGKIIKDSGYTVTDLEETSIVNAIIFGV